MPLNFRKDVEFIKAKSIQVRRDIAKHLVNIYK